MKAYLGIGTNIGDRLENLKSTLDALNLLPFTKVTDVSEVYETDPVGYEAQDDFLNIVAEIETELSPENLLGAALGIEAALGRVRTIKNGPRIIDVDLLLYGDEKRKNNTLILPHPRMTERNFVLRPLSDLNVCSSLISKEEITEKCSDVGVRLFCSGDVFGI